MYIVSKSGSYSSLTIPRYTLYAIRGYFPRDFGYYMNSFFLFPPPPPPPAPSFCDFQIYYVFDVLCWSLGPVNTVLVTSGLHPMGRAAIAIGLSKFYRLYVVVKSSQEADQLLAEFPEVGWDDDSDSLIVVLNYILINDGSRRL